MNCAWCRVTVELDLQLKFLFHVHTVVISVLFSGFRYLTRLAGIYQWVMYMSVVNVIF